MEAASCEFQPDAENAIWNFSLILWFGMLVVAGPFSSAVHRLNRNQFTTAGKPVWWAKPCDSSGQWPVIGRCFEHSSAHYAIGEDEFSKLGPSEAVEFTELEHKVLLFGETVRACAWGYCALSSPQLVAKDFARVLKRAGRCGAFCFQVGLPILLYEVVLCIRMALWMWMGLGAVLTVLVSEDSSTPITEPAFWMFQNLIFAALNMRQQKNVAEGSEIWVDYSSGGHTLGSQVPLRECYPGTPATLTASRRHMG